MERDDVIEYSLDSHHSEEEGVQKRKTIWKVTAILTLITVVEVAVGVLWGRGTVSDGAWLGIKVGYIILTLVKAAYIVLSFMHLGEERKSLRYAVLAPYVFFIIYMVLLIFNEGNFQNGLL